MEDWIIFFLLIWFCCFYFFSLYIHVLVEAQQRSDDMRKVHMSWVYTCTHTHRREVRAHTLIYVLIDSGNLNFSISAMGEC